MATIALPDVRDLLRRLVAQTPEDEMLRRLAIEFLTFLHAMSGPPFRDLNDGLRR